MRLIETGVKDGKSCVVKETEIVHDEGDDISIVHLLDLAPARLPPRPEGKGEFVDIPVAPGEARWYRVRFPASQLRLVHHHRHCRLPHHRRRQHRAAARRRRASSRGWRQRDRHRRRSWLESGAKRLRRVDDRLRDAEALSGEAAAHG
jgi:hypothetical protein